MTGNRAFNEIQLNEFVGSIPPVVVAASGAAPVPDLSLTGGGVVVYTMSAAVTVGAPINPRQVGEPLFMVFIQDTTAGRTLAFNSAFRNAPSINGSAATAGQRCSVLFRYDGAGWQYVGGSTVFA